MKTIEVRLLISDSDYEAIKKQVVCVGNVEGLKLNITEVMFTESPKYELKRISGELI